jgi:D-alanyl-D-alanine carboxypeptidase
MAMKSFRSTFILCSLLLALPSVAATSFVMKLIDKTGARTVIQNQRGDVLVKPASTMKLFTAWAALNQGVRTDSYISEMLRMSNNAMADATTVKLGGVAGLTDILSRDGVPVTAESFKAVDGSGLSKSNRSTCNIQIDLLEHIYDSPEYDRYRLLLARPGGVGTLDVRLLSQKGKIFAKTGTLKTTSALTGYAITSKGTALFCIISEGFTGTWAQERARIDALLVRNLLAVEALRPKTP